VIAALQALVVLWLLFRVDELRSRVERLEKEKRK
jgi:hypothetical protein